MLAQHTARLRKLGRLLLQPLYRTGLRHGVAAAVEHEAALRGLALASIVDAGANKGQFTLLARQLFPRAIIHAFEPLREETAYFRKLLSADHAITLHIAALGEKNGTALIHISGHTDSSSLLPIGPCQEKHFPGTGLIATHTVTLMRGDDALNGIDLPRPLMIKLDVQGSELAALQGLRKTLERTDYVYAEISFLGFYIDQPLASDIITFLHEQGFRLSGIFNPVNAKEGGIVQADALFVQDRSERP